VDPRKFSLFAQCARQTFVMAAIVATLLCIPLAALLALLSLGLLDIPLQSFLTFGGRANAFVGVLLWWAIAFVPALAYAAFAMPTDPAPGV
jgi:hypothetical protein